MAIFQMQTLYLLTSMLILECFTDHDYIEHVLIDSSLETVVLGLDSDQQELHCLQMTCDENRRWWINSLIIIRVFTFMILNICMSQTWLYPIA